MVDLSLDGGPGHSMADRGPVMLDQDLRMVDPPPSRVKPNKAKKKGMDNANKSRRTYEIHFTKTCACSNRCTVEHLQGAAAVKNFVKGGEPRV